MLRNSIRAFNKTLKSTVSARRIAVGGIAAKNEAILSSMPFEQLKPSLRQHRTIVPASLSRLFAPLLQFEKWEIHTVFLHFLNFELEQKSRLSLLVKLCGAALKILLETGIRNSIIPALQATWHIVRFRPQALPSASSQSPRKHDAYPWRQDCHSPVFRCRLESWHSDTAFGHTQ